MLLEFVKSGLFLLLMFICLRVLRKIIVDYYDMRYDCLGFQIYTEDLDVFEDDVIDKMVLDNLCKSGVYWFVNEDTKRIYIEPTSCLYDSIKEDVLGDKDLSVHIDIHDECVKSVSYIVCNEKLINKVAKQMIFLYGKNGYHLYE